MNMAVETQLSCWHENMKRHILPITGKTYDVKIMFHGFYENISDKYKSLKSMSYEKNAVKQVAYKATISAPLIPRVKS
jgi:hypothetical protein